MEIVDFEIYYIGVSIIISFILHKYLVYQKHFSRKIKFLKVNVEGIQREKIYGNA